MSCGGNLDRLTAPSFGLLFVIVLGFGSAGGCASLFSQFMAEDPHLDGEWTGRLCSVVVRDVKGREYDAAALRIEAGPRTKPRFGDQPYTIPEEALIPLNRRGKLIVNPKELGVPVGSLVRVRGTIWSTGMGVYARGAEGHQSYEPVSMREVWQPDGELMLQLRGQLRELRRARREKRGSDRTTPVKSKQGASERPPRKSSMSTWSRAGRWFLSSCLGLAAASGAGCSQLLSRAVPKSPHAEGTWTGRLAAVTVGREKRDSALPSPE